VSNVNALTWVCRDSSVGIASRYGLDGPGVESRWGPPKLLPAQWVPALFREGKRPGRGVSHPPLSSAEVKERVELCFPSRPSWRVLGRTLGLTWSYNYLKISVFLAVAPCNLVADVSAEPVSSLPGRVPGIFIWSQQVFPKR
jgi:hypothetical protein